MGKLFLILVVVATAEIYLLMELGGWLGAPATIGLVLATAFLGSYLVRRQGTETLMRLQQRTATGQSPHGEMLEGAGLIIAGAFLVTPGFVTDACGFLLLVPKFRRELVAALVVQLQAKAEEQQKRQQAFFEQMQNQHRQQHNPHGGHPPEHNEDIVDADVVEIIDDDKGLPKKD